MDRPLRHQIDPRGDAPPFEHTLAEIRERDQGDASRDVAPMIAADDAITIDASTLSIDEVIARPELFVRDAATD